MFFYTNASLVIVSLRFNPLVILFLWWVPRFSRRLNWCGTLSHGGFVVVLVWGFVVSCFCISCVVLPLLYRLLLWTFGLAAYYAFVQFNEVLWNIFGFSGAHGTLIGTLRWWRCHILRDERPHHFRIFLDLVHVVNNLIDRLHHYFRLWHWLSHSV